jgi:hypothetical protein
LPLSLTLLLLKMPKAFSLGLATTSVCNNSENRPIPSALEPL